MGKIHIHVHDVAPQSLVFQGKKYIATGKVSTNGAAEYEAVNASGERTGARVWRSTTGTVTMDAAHPAADAGVAPNSPLERANRMIQSIQGDVAKLQSITGELGADGGSIDNARRSLKKIAGAAETALRLIG